MATTLIASVDIAPFADIEADKLAAMIDDVTARAISVAPCLADNTDPQILAAAKSILRQAILRWNDTESGVVTTQQAGPFSQTIDASARRSGLLWPSEITDLQNLCKSGDTGAYGIDRVGGRTVVHADICSIRFDPTAGCSCGAILTAYGPLWENR